LSYTRRQKILYFFSEVITIIKTSFCYLDSYFLQPSNIIYINEQTYTCYKLPDFIGLAVDK